MLGRDELSKTPDDTARRALLLTDGQLNVGIIEPEQVNRIVADGQERSMIRTSTLGFGDSYNEDVLESLATISGGNFYDANSPDKLAPIFAAELDGLQKTAAQNVRMRIRRLTFCENWKPLASYHSVDLPDGRTELAVGDLVSEESATVILQMEVLPLPVLADGSPVASLEGEPVVELEILWDDLTGAEVKSCNYKQIIRLMGTQNPEEVRLDVDIIPGLATQRSGRAIEEALREIGGGSHEAALQILKDAARQLRDLGHEDRLGTSLALLDGMIRKIETGVLDARSRKGLRYSSSHMTKMKSRAMWSLDQTAPSYSESSLQPPPADPGAEAPKSGADDGTRPDGSIS